MRIEATTHYLEMKDHAQLVPSRHQVEENVKFSRAEIPSPEFSRFLYTAVGGDFHWTQRLSWSYAEWLAYVDRPEFEAWVLSVSGTPAGYCELEVQPEGNVEICSFGLLPQFIARRLGGFALTEAVKRAWALGARRVWLHTWTLDHEHALSNYLSRGFTVYDTQTQTIDIPESPPGPWPGAGRHR